MNGVLIVVSRTKPGQYTYLRHAFEKEAIDVILDRRAEERAGAKSQRLSRGAVEIGANATSQRI